jgi:hypothetical protein
VVSSFFQFQYNLAPPMRIAIDTGGTFTDCVFLRDGRLEILKVFSTPANPARAIAQAVADVRQRLGEIAAPVDLLHGTTVGTNALLERRGGRVASSPPKASRTCWSSDARRARSFTTSSSRNRRRWWTPLAAWAFASASLLMAGSSSPSHRKRWQA